MTPQLASFITIVIAVCGLFLGSLRFLTGNLKDRVKDLETRMIMCESARGDLAKQNVDLLTKLVGGQVLAAERLATSNAELAKSLMKRKSKE